MNMAQKAFCRLVQGGFRLALPLLPYREPKILNRVEQVAELTVPLTAEAKWGESWYDAK